MRSEKKSGPSGPLSRLQHFWDCHKWHLLIAAVLLAAAWMAVRDLTGRETADVKITFISAVTYGEDVCREQMSILESAAPGGLTLGYSFILLPETTEGQKTYQDAVHLSKLMVEISEGKNCIVLMDENARKVLEAYEKDYFSEICEVPAGFTAPGIVQKLMIGLKAPEQSRCSEAAYEREKLLFNTLRESFTMSNEGMKF